MNFKPTPDLQAFTRNDCEPSELAKVYTVANSLLAHMQLPEIMHSIAEANVHRKPSQAVQACVLDFLASQGFQSEKKGLFSRYKTAGLRPDYYRSLSPGRGIILEVERGKTVHNNMDILDLWKCHICEDAQYLFLLVPFIRLDEKGGRIKVYEKVIDRIEPFFREENYVNVNGVFIFGY